MKPPKQNDDFSWLVYADYLDDNGIPGAAEIRNQIGLPILPDWQYEYRGVGGVGSVGGGVGVGSVGSGVGVGGGGVGGGGVGGGVGVGGGGVGVGGSVGGGN